MKKILALIFIAVMVYSFSQKNIWPPFGKNIVLAQSSPVSENLNELFARKSRYAAVSWGPSFLEDADNNYTWQPETMTYTDTGTGSEI